MKLKDVQPGAEYALTDYPSGEPKRASECAKVKVLGIDRDRGSASRTRSIVRCELIGLRAREVRMNEGRMWHAGRWVAPDAQLWVSPANLACTWEDAEAVEQVAAAKERHISGRRAALEPIAVEIAGRMGATFAWPADWMREGSVSAEVTFTVTAAPRQLAVALEHVADDARVTVHVDVEDPQARADLFAALCPDAPVTPVGLTLAVTGDLVAAQAALTRLDQDLLNAENEQRSALLAHAAGALSADDDGLLVLERDIRAAVLIPLLAALSDPDQASAEVTMTLDQLQAFAVE